MDNKATEAPGLPFVGVMRNDKDNHRFKTNHTTSADTAADLHIEISAALARLDIITTNGYSNSP